MYLAILGDAAVSYAWTVQQAAKQGTGSSALHCDAEYGGGACIKYNTIHKYYII